MNNLVIALNPQLAMRIGNMFLRLKAEGSFHVCSIANPSSDTLSILMNKTCHDVLSWGHKISPKGVQSFTYCQCSLVSLRVDNFLLIAEALTPRDEKASNLTGKALYIVSMVVCDHQIDTMSANNCYQLQMLRPLELKGIESRICQSLLYRKDA